MRAVFIFVHCEILFGRIPELEIRAFSTARDGEAAYHEHLAASVSMPGGEPPVPVLCSYPGCYYPPDITREKNRRVIAWFGASILNEACLICSLIWSSPFSLTFPIILEGKEERPRNRTFLSI